jgi:5-methylcytosine-specific restriction endonuclease McrA
MEVIMPKKPANKITKRTRKVSDWEQRFTEKLKTVHQRNIAIKAKKLMRKTTAALTSMKKRSDGAGADCTITLDDIREMTEAAYGSECRYTGRVLTIENIVYDHIVPVAKGGPSTKENIQVISRFANNMKGSLTEEDFLILLNWLKQLPEDLSKEVAFRLAGGRRR